MLFAVESPLWVVTFCRQTNLNRCFFRKQHDVRARRDNSILLFRGVDLFHETVKNYSEIFICLCQYNLAFFQAGKVKFFLVNAIDYFWQQMGSLPTDKFIFPAREFIFNMFWFSSKINGLL